MVSTAEKMFEKLKKKYKETLMLTLGFYQGRHSVDRPVRVSRKTLHYTGW